jgi:membrane-associated phospholipid phosphatase
MLTEAPALVLLARQLGEHSLAWFACVLALSVFGSAVACQAWQQRRARTRPTGEPEEPRLAAALAMGFLVILGAASLVAYIASKLGDGRLLGLADQALADAIGDHVPWAALVAFSWLTHLGDAELLAPVCLMVALLLWRKAHHGLALGWVMALGGIVLLNPALKRIFARARPLHDHGLALETSFSFPSGHSAGAIVSYGMLMYLALRLLPARWHVPAAMAAAAAIVTIACSRVFLQVHFASDVAAGLLTGLAWLLVCVSSLEYARHRKRRAAR